MKDVLLNFSFDSKFKLNSFRYNNFFLTCFKTFINIFGNYRLFSLFFIINTLYKYLL